jgi:hypothetical protein
MTRVRVALVLAVASTATIGCSARTEAPIAEVTAPGNQLATASPASQPPAPPFSIVLVGSIPDSCQTPGETIPGPTVLITDNGVPVRNVPVSFQVVSGNGTVVHTSDTTDANGLASGGGWTLGSGVGDNFMRATVGSGDNMRGVEPYVSAAVPAKVVAVYQLQSVLGKSVPLNYDGGTYVTGGHYYLGADGTYAFGYESGPTAVPATICSSTHYVVGSGAIDFYLAPGSSPDGSFYPEHNWLFSVGTLGGPSLSVKYVDSVDFDDEVYTLVSGTVPPPTMNRLP